MHGIALPTKYKYTAIDSANGKVEIFGCYPGYGTTLGNALRRVLLSSLSGAAVTSVKIKGVSHEFSTVPGVMEDVVQIILNLKKVRFEMHSDEPLKVTLKAKGEGPVTAKSIQCPSQLQVVSPDQLIATITDKKTELEMELEVAGGIGYVPVEQQVRDEKEIGVIAIDAVYTPIRRVNYEVENMRVGKRTDYHKITMDIATDGSISPQDAFVRATQILVDQFSALLAISQEKAEEEIEVEAAPMEAVADEMESEAAAEATDLKTIKVTELTDLSTRTLNVLESNKINKVKDLLKHSEESLTELEGMGDKGIKEIKKALGEFGLTLK